MSAKVIPILTLDQAVRAIHKQFGDENDADRKAQRCRIRCGHMLVELRQRIEKGEAGPEWSDNWWGWYKTKFVRSRKDAEKVMRLASDDDPEAAQEEEKAEARTRMRRVRARHGANKADVRSKTEDDDLVTHALRLVEQMDATQRRRFFAILKKEYTNHGEDQQAHHRADDAGNQCRAIRHR